MAAHISTLPNSRLRTMVIPREHGAWGMMLVPLTTGAIVALPSGINVASLTLFIIAAMSLFWLRTPIEAWLGTSAVKAQTPQERAFVLRVMIGIGLLATASVVALLWNGRNARMPAQVIGAVGLTSTAAGAYYVAAGKLDHVALALWLANWLFAGNQIHFVQMRIHSSRATTTDEKLRQGFPFFAGQVGLIGVILAACRFGLFPGPVALALVPVLFRGTLWFVRGRRPLDVHKLGFSELTQALVFGALLCAAFLV